VASGIVGAPVGEVGGEVVGVIIVGKVIGFAVGEVVGVPLGAAVASGIVRAAVGATVGERVGLAVRDEVGTPFRKLPVKLWSLSWEVESDHRSEKSLVKSWELPSETRKSVRWLGEPSDFPSAPLPSLSSVHQRHHSHHGPNSNK